LRPAQRRANIWLVASLVGFSLANALRFWAAPAVDETFGRWVRSLATPPLDAAMAALTHLGDPLALVPLTVAAAIYAFASGHRRASLLIVVFGLSVIFWTRSLKWYFARPRPGAFGPLPVSGSGAFPSGHTLGATAIYGMIAVHLRRNHDRLWWTVWLSGIVAVVVGFSRMYLAVHWTTDVLAGWTLGGAHIAAFASSLAHWSSD